LKNVIRGACGLLLWLSLSLFAIGQRDQHPLTARSPQETLINQFVHGHTYISAKFDFFGNGVKIGTASFQLSRLSGTKVRFQLTSGPVNYIFVADRRWTLDIYPNDKTYDRLTAYPNPIPRARNAEGNVPYLLPLAVGYLGVPASGPNFKQTAKDSESATYQSTVSAPTGTAVYTFKIGNDGRLLQYSRHLQNSTAGWDFFATSYSFDPIPKQEFSTNPPLGYLPYAFTDAPAPLVTHQALPAVKSLSKKSINSIVKNGDWMVVMTDELIPSGLKSGLAALPKNLHLLGLCLPGRIGLLKGILPAGTQAYEMSEASFDEIGVAKTPQFYLLRNGKLLQAWIGFDRANSAQWIKEVIASIRDK